MLFFLQFFHFYLQPFWERGVSNKGSTLGAPTEEKNQVKFFIYKQCCGYGYNVIILDPDLDLGPDPN